MKYYIKEVITLLIIVFFTFFKNVDAGKIDNFTLKDLDNKRVSFSDIKGEQLTLLDFWATWCKPCTRAIPELIILYEAYKDSGVQLIGISVDSPRNQIKVKPFVTSMGITYPILLDSNSELMSELQVTALPTLLIINDQREIVLIHRGYRPGDEIMLKEEIDKWLDNKSPESEDE